MSKNDQKKKNQKKQKKKKAPGHISQFKAAEKRRQNVPLFTTSDVVLQPSKKEKVYKPIGTGHRKKKEREQMSVQERLKNAHRYEAMLSKEHSGHITVVQHRPMDLQKYIKKG